MINQVLKFLRRKCDPIELLERLVPENTPLENIVHVGAHLAQERCHYELHGYKNVLWVEGSEQIYRRLVDIVGNHHGTANHVTRCALLTDQDGAEVELRHYNNDGASSSIFSPSEQWQSRWPEVGETGETEKRISCTLDTLLAQTPFESRCDVLVVDVQGAELLVLKGAIKTLASATAVICEISTVQYYAGGVLYNELAQFMRTQGFIPMATPRRHADMLFMRRHASIKAA
jgi:FkbM family methyltransferase